MGAEIPSGRVKFDPQSSDKNVFVTPPPSFILSLSFFSFYESLVLLSVLLLLLLRSLLSFSYPSPPLVSSE